MKSLVALLATFLAVGIGVDLFAQEHALSLPNPSGSSNTTGVGTTSKNAGSGQPGDNTPSNVDGDDSVVRLKTSDSMAAGAMSRDEGQLTRKQLARERVSEVDSTKKLKTSGTDGKFEASLLHSSVTSIDDVSAKSSEAAEGQAPTQGVPRILRHKIFVTPKNDDSKKNETAQAKADSSPSSSPSPSPNASPGAAHR
ncbi:MAG: hypothetical protein JO201_03100 [Verrucomicrobia bacterium]|nr:hypothetical protein [Verrucomicrobiota bacterium]